MRAATMRRHRMRRKLTQAQLARRAGVTQGYISQLEAGAKKELGARVALRLARALGCSITDLLR